jgi:hypothetical protein
VSGRRRRLVAHAQSASGGRRGRGHRGAARTGGGAAIGLVAANCGR